MLTLTCASVPDAKGIENRQDWGDTQIAANDLAVSTLRGRGDDADSVSGPVCPQTIESTRDWGGTRIAVDDPELAEVRFFPGGLEDLSWGCRHTGLAAGDTKGATAMRSLSSVVAAWRGGRTAAPDCRATRVSSTARCCAWECRMQQRWGRPEARREPAAGAAFRRGQHERRLPSVLLAEGQHADGGTAVSPFINACNFLCVFGCAGVAELAADGRIARYAFQLCHRMSHAHSQQQIFGD